jgi:hypothetical protein
MTKFNSLIALNYKYAPRDGIGNKFKQLMTAFDPFTKFLVQQKNNGIFTSVEKSRLAFVKENHIKYLIIRPESSLDSIFLSHVVKTIADADSKERFIKLDF